MHRAWRVGITLLVLLAVPSADAQWPSFHKDSRNGGSSSAPFNLYEDVWWSSSTDGAPVEASPVVEARHVVVADWDGVVRGLDADTGKERWSHTMKAKVVGTPAIALGRVYVADAGGDLVALDLETGALLATAKTGATRAPVTFHEGKVFLGNEAGEMRSYTADNLDLLWTFKVSSVYDVSSYNNVTDVTTCTGAAHPARPIRTAPAVYNGFVYFGAMNHYVYAVDEHGRPDGTTPVQWTYRTGDIVVSSPVVDPGNGRVVVASYDNHVHALPALPVGAGADRCFGVHASPAWSYTVPGAIDESRVHSTPALHKGSLYFGATNGRVYALDALTGAKRWDFQTGGSVLSSPAAAGFTVVVGSDDGHVYWLHADDGRVLADFFAAGPVKTSPALDGASAYVTTDDGVTFRLGPPAPPRPDLLVTELTATKESLTVTVRNGGGYRSPPTVVEVTGAGDPLRLDVPALAAGESRTMTHAVQLSPGDVSLSAVVDPADEIAEAQDANNAFEASVRLSEPVPEPTEPLPLPSLTTNATDNVTGNATAGGLPMWVYTGGGGLVIAAGGGVFLWFRRRRQLAAVAAEDEDLEE